jgi:cbb3-type cytochrome oxidase maturation protein
MDILYLLIPISIVLVFLVIGLFWWALQAGQFDNIEREGERIFEREEDRRLGRD